MTFPVCLRPLAIGLFAASVLAACASGPPESPQAGLMGQGFGIDHAALLVSDLEAARTQYAEVFGFDLPDLAESGRHPSGTKNVSTYFANQSYLELIAIDDAEKIAREKPYYPAFLARFEGGVRFFALSTSSASRTWQWLTGRGFNPPSPEPGRVVRPGRADDGQPGWYTVDLAEGDPLADLPFFIEYTDYPYAEVFADWDAGYTEARASSGYAQPNGVTGIHAIVIATADLPATRATYQRMGLKEEGAPSEVGVRFSAGHGEIRLIDAVADPAAAAFVAARGNGVMTLEFNVANIEATARVLSDRVHTSGVELRSDGTIFVPADLAWGVNLVFVQE